MNQTDNQRFIYDEPKLVENEKEEEQRQQQLLKNLYRDKNSGLFLLKDTKKFYEKAKAHAKLANVSYETIQRFKVRENCMCYSNSQIQISTFIILFASQRLKASPDQKLQRF